MKIFINKNDALKIEAKNPPKKVCRKLLAMFALYVWWRSKKWNEAWIWKHFLLLLSWRWKWLNLELVTMIVLNVKLSCLKSCVVFTPVCGIIHQFWTKMNGVSFDLETFKWYSTPNTLCENVFSKFLHPKTQYECTFNEISSKKWW